MNTDYSVLVPPVAKLFGRYGIETGFLVATATAMSKSIMDATWPLREFLARGGFHDYRLQAKGVAAKKVYPVEIVNESGHVLSNVSLYRPETKEGDPRIWIYGLGQHAAPGELMALILDDGKLFMVNCARVNVAALLADGSSFLGRLALKLDKNAPAAAELLGNLRMLAAEGFVPSMRFGATGVGYTLETRLGIEANSRKAPDFKGIELKSSRVSNKSKLSRRVTLFSSVPEWNISAFQARQSLETFGYRESGSGRLQLYCSVDAVKPNSLGFQLDLRFDKSKLFNLNVSRNPGGEEVFVWLLEALRSSFLTKHRETFWVKANSKVMGGVEHFHYISARHTRNPSISAFERLLSDGGICVDLTMSEKSNASVRDHGYLFRVQGVRFDELFPEVATYVL